MSNTAILDKIKKIEEQIAQEESFISSPNSYIYDLPETMTEGESVEYLRAIAYHNDEIISKKRANIKRLQEIISSSVPITPTEEIITEKEESQIPQTLNHLKDLSDIIKLLDYGEYNADTERLIIALSQTERIRLKLYYSQKRISIKAAIKGAIINNPTENISKLQDDYSLCEFALSFIQETEDKQKEVAVKDSERVTPSRIVLVPNLKNKTTYLCEDILNYSESKKEIKNIFDKLIDGYFLKTKDTKVLEGYKDYKLYEYKHPNGIRILYIAIDGYIFVCSLFYKNKQKSIKITNYYEEAISRYQNSTSYLAENIMTPDFYIEQDEYIAEINSALEQGVSYKKKVGDYDE